MRALSIVSLLLVVAPALAAAAPAPDDAPAPAPAETAPPAEPAESAPAEPAESAPAEPAPPPPVTPPALARPATAAASSDEEPIEAPRTRYPYRWQVVGVDAGTILLSIATNRLSDGGRPGGLATITIAAYFFAAPMVHGAHRQGLRALASFGMRAGLPLLLGVLGEQLDGTPDCSTCKDTLRSDGKLIGLTAGVLIAMAVDGALLARPIYRRVERPRAAWAPALHGVRGGALAGVLGTF